MTGASLARLAAVTTAVHASALAAVFASVEVAPLGARPSFVGFFVAAQLVPGALAGAAALALSRRVAPLPRPALLALAALAWPLGAWAAAVAVPALGVPLGLALGHPLAAHGAHPLRALAFVALCSATGGVATGALQAALLPGSFRTRLAWLVCATAAWGLAGATFMWPWWPRRHGPLATGALAAACFGGAQALGVWALVRTRRPPDTA